MFGMLLVACDRISPNGKYRAAATQKYDQTPPTITPTTNKQSSDIGSEPPGPAVKINALWVDGDRVDFSTTKTRPSFLHSHGPVLCVFGLY